MNISRIVTILLSAFLTACVVMPPKDPLYSGEYFYNFESSFLTPEGKDEAWCIDAGKMSKAMLPATDANGSWGTSHVVLRGKLGPEGVIPPQNQGSFGGLGRCKRVLDITEVVQVTNMRGRE